MELLIPELLDPWLGSGSMELFWGCFFLRRGLEDDDEDSCRVGSVLIAWEEVLRSVMSISSSSSDIEPSSPVLCCVGETRV